MKVLLVNGGPHKLGCTNRALEEVAGALEREGVEAEIFWIGANRPRDAWPAGAAARPASASSTTR